MTRRLLTRAALLLVGLAALCHPVTASAADDGTGAVRAITGRLTVIQSDDFDNHRSEVFLQVEDEGDGEVYRFDLPAALAAGVRTGMRVRVEGLVQGNEIRLAGGIAPAMDVLGMDVSMAAEDERRVMVLVVDFVDSAVECSDGAISGILFEDSLSVDGLYRATTFDQVGFPSDTDGNGQPDVLRVTIPSSSTGSCDPNGWASQADAAATSAGVNLGLYQHRLYVLPGNSPCSWAGLAHVGCFGSCRAWVDTCSLPDVYAHELGHNLGMRHASTDDDQDGTADCEYCDGSDFMGYGGVGWRGLNGAHMYETGWLPPGKILDLAPPSQQTVTLGPLDIDPTETPHPQVVRIPRPSGSPLYLSYRRRAGYDTGLGGSYADRTSIHLLSGSGNTLFLQALADGQTFEDTAADIVVTQVSHDGSSAILSIEVGCSGQGCPQDQPPAEVLNLHRTDVAHGGAGNVVSHMVTLPRDTVAHGDTTSPAGPPDP